MSNAVFSQAVRGALKKSKDMPPVTPGRNPLVGFAMGFLFGPIGVGLYLKSFGDFFLTLAIVIGSVFVTGGVAAPVVWSACGIWAYTRIRNSNSAPSIPGRLGMGIAPSLPNQVSCVPRDERENVVVRVHHS